MRQKVLIFLLAAIFVFSQAAIVDAKGASFKSSGSRSFSVKSSGSSRSSASVKSSPKSSASKGYSGSSSSSKGVSSSSGSSKGSAPSSSGYSGSPSSSKGSGSDGSSRSIPGSYSSSSSAKSAKSSTMKNSYMQDQYKKEASKTNYKAYQQKLNPEQQKAYDSSFNKSYTVNNRMNFEDAMRTRPQRINVYNSRPIYIHVNPTYFGGPLSYGSGFIGPWDLWFVTRASDLFWYHHWSDMYANRAYFDAAEFAARENAIKQLEAQNIARDSSYLDPDVDSDLQFSSDYAQKNPNTVYYTNKYSNPGASPIVVLLIISGIVIVLIIIIRKSSRPRMKKTYNSRIY